LPGLTRQSIALQKISCSMDARVPATPKASPGSEPERPA
jgi:hypothetical protein